MERAKLWISQQDESWFYVCNRWPAAFVLFFQWITHLGGARMTIGIQVLLLLMAPLAWRPAVIAATIALGVSHLLMGATKRTVRRIRPYLALPEAQVYGYMFKDHSFPSGHSTAIFSLIASYLYFFPDLTIFLMPIACLVAFSRVVLGVHYPTDVVAGAILGSTTALIVQYFF